MAWTELDIEVTAPDLNVSLKMLDHEEGYVQYGISRVYLTFGGTPLDGIAMIARYPSGTTHKYITSRWDHAEEWYKGHDATQADLSALVDALRDSENDHSRDM